MAKSLTKLACVSSVVAALFASSSAFASTSANLENMTQENVSVEYLSEVTSMLGNQALAAINGSQALSNSETEYLSEVTSALGSQALALITSSACDDSTIEVANL